MTFDVIRKGKDIGDYTVTFRGKGGDLDVDLRTDVKVKVPVIGVSAYTFRQQSTETWRGGKLAALSSKTDDNGTPHSISVGATPLIPASLWSADLLAARQVLNTINGGTDTISVRKLGTESVATGSGSVKAAHYAVSGGLNRGVHWDGDLTRPDDLKQASVLVDGYKVAATASQAQAELYARMWEASMKQYEASQNLTMQAAKINGDALMHTNDARLDANKVGAQVMAQQVSSAFNAVATSASISGSASMSMVQQV